jgi:hypothetical protein
MTGWWIRQRSFHVPVLTLLAVLLLTNHIIKGPELSSYTGRLSDLLLSQTVKTLRLALFYNCVHGLGFDGEMKQLHRLS